MMDPELQTAMQEAALGDLRGKPPRTAGNRCRTLQEASALHAAGNYEGPLALTPLQSPTSRPGRPTTAAAACSQAPAAHPADARARHGQ
eukprot:9768163-Alexandrium_andersonii.AAC.1